MSGGTTVSAPPQDPPPRAFGLAIAGTVAHVGPFLALFAMYAFMVPAAKRAFDNYGLTLPKLTLLVIQVSNWVADYWWAMVPVVLAGGAANFALIARVGARHRTRALVWIVGASAVMACLLVVTFVAIQIPKAKLAEALSK